MIIKNFDLVGIANTLNEFSGSKLPQKISFSILMNMNKLKSYVNAYQESLNKIIETYKDYILKDENGNQVLNGGIPMVDDEHSEEYEKEVIDLLSIEIEIDLYTIDAKLFDYDDTNKYDVLSAQDIFRLQSILCKQEEDKTK